MRKKKGGNASKEAERMCNTSKERKCREKCFKEKKCKENDEDCKKKCRSRCCDYDRTKAKQGSAIKDANERLCNTAEERECRKECFEDKKCSDNDEDCKKVRLLLD